MQTVFELRKNAVYRLSAGLLALGLLVSLAGTVWAQDKEELSVLHCWRPPRQAWVDDQIEYFLQKHPNVTVTSVTTGCNSLAAQLLVSLAANTPFDVVLMRAEDMTELASQGSLVDLSPYMERDGISRDIWFPAEMQGVTWEGGVYALPHRAGSDMNNILLYNPQIFEESGLDPDAPPTTFQELDEVARSVTRFNGDEIAIAPYDFTDQGTYGAMAWLYAGGGSFFNADATQVAFNSTEGLNTIEFVRDFIARHLRGSENLLGGNQAFASGRLAMMGRGTFSYAEIKAINPDIPIAMSLRPKLPESQWSGVSEPTLVFGIPKGISRPDLAWDLVYYLTVHEESAGGFLLRQGRPSPIREYNFNPAYFEVNPYFGIIPQAMETAYPLPVVGGFTDAITTFRHMWIGLERDPALSPSSEFEEAARVINAILRERAR